MISGRSDGRTGLFARKKSCRKKCRRLRLEIIRGYRRLTGDSPASATLNPAETATRSESPRSPPHTAANARSALQASAADSTPGHEFPPDHSPDHKAAKSPAPPDRGSTPLSTAPAES